MASEPKHAAAYPHYYRPVGGLTHVDVYRVLELFGVTSPHMQHAIKKLLAAGHRGTKDQAKDVREAIVTLERWEEMRGEDTNKSEGDLLFVPHPDTGIPLPRHPDLGPEEPTFASTGGREGRD